MAKDRLKFLLKWFSVLYMAFITFMLLAIYILGYYFDYFVDGRLNEFCKTHIAPQSGERYDYKINEDNACLFDWWRIIFEVVILPLGLYFIFMLPAIIVFRFVRRK